MILRYIILKHKKSKIIISGFLIAFLAFVILIFPLDYLFANSNIFFPPFVFEEQKITPGTQKAVYLTGYGSMGNKKKRQQIYELIDKTEINSIVFDAKDDNGYIDYNCTISEVLKTGAVKSYYDIDEILGEFEKMDIYSIARFVVFKDNVLPRARTDFAMLNKNTGNPISLEGSTWVDIYCEEAWDYYINIIKDLVLRGVDEISRVASGTVESN